jgi:L-histidine N-alpha-methyltransferase
MVAAPYRIERAREGARQAALMAQEVRGGLTAPQPWLPCKYLYDDRGSRLFERITALPEYYQTRTEERILEGIADEVIGWVGPRELVELGSGAGRKIRLLLDSMARHELLERCALLDINERYLTESVRCLAADYPGLEVRGYVADFLRDLDAIGPGGGRLMVFLAGTIGNVHPEEVSGFLARVSAALEPGDGLLLGLDLVKDAGRLEAAYNDAAGVTAAFNLNILRVLNSRLGADFDLGAFEHVAFYDREKAWVEMRLRAVRDSRVRIPRPRLDLRFRRGDEIRTEISCKYTRASLEGKLPGTGLVLDRWFTDAAGLFALALLGRTDAGVTLAT